MLVGRNSLLTIIVGLMLHLIYQYTTLVDGDYHDTNLLVVRHAD